MNDHNDDRHWKFAFITFFIGCLLFIASLFVDWYYFRAYSISGDLIADWTYSISFDWVTSFRETVSSNQILKPNTIFNPLILLIFSLITVFTCLYGLTKGMMDNLKSMDEIKPFAGANIFLLLIDITLMIGIPVVFFMPSNLYFPFLELIDIESMTKYFFSVGPGYILQIISFICLFPHAVFTLQTINKFEKETHSPNQYIERQKKEAIHPIKIDLLIEEEKNRIESSLNQEDEATIIISSFKNSRRNFR